MEAARDDRTELLLALGLGLHQAGIATDTLERTLLDVAVSCGVALEVNALPTSLTLAIGPPFEQRLIIRRLEPGKLHLRKLALLEGVVDALRRGREAGPALADVTRIDSAVRPDWPPLTVVAYLLLSCGAALLLGGAVREVIVAGLVGIAIGVIAAVANVRGASIASSRSWRRSSRR